MALLLLQCLPMGAALAECAEHHATCQSNGLCVNCGEACDGAVEHNWDWGNCQSDETHHWFICIHCGEIAGKVEHFEGSRYPGECAVCSEPMPTVQPTAESTIEPTVEPIAPVKEPAHQHAFNGSLPVGDGTHRALCTVYSYARVDKCKLVPTMEGTKEITACSICGYVVPVAETVAQIEVKTISRLDDKVALRVFYVASEVSAPIAAEAPATLRLPCEKEEAETITQMKLVLIRQDGTMVEISFEIIDGEIVFETDELGMFAFVPADTIIQ